MATPAPLPAEHLLTTSAGRASVPRATGLTALSDRERDRVFAARVRILTEIAERYREFTEPLNGSSGIRGTGDLTPRMPATYTATVRQFERVAALLRDSPDLAERELWWHLNGWWLGADTRTAWHCPRCGICHQAEHRHPNRRSGVLSTVQCKRVVAWRRLPGARESEAKRAIEMMARAWPDEMAEPMLPPVELAA